MAGRSSRMDDTWQGALSTLGLWHLIAGFLIFDLVLGGMLLITWLTDKAVTPLLLAQATGSALSLGLAAFGALVIFALWHSPWLRPHTWWV